MSTVLQDIAYPWCLCTSQLYFIGNFIHLGALLTIVLCWQFHSSLVPYWLFWLMLIEFCFCSESNVMTVDLVSCTGGKFPFLAWSKFYILRATLMVLILVFWNWNPYSDAWRCSAEIGKGKFSCMCSLVSQLLICSFCSLKELFESLLCSQG